MPELPKIIAVIGPTASGKTALGVSLPQKFGGAIVSADAKQVFRKMDIGTAKEKELPVPQMLIDIRNPGERITVGEYQSLAYAAIDGLLTENRLPILVGGSGLYAESVLEGYEFGGQGSKRKAPRYRSLKLGLDIDRESLKARARVRLLQRLDYGLVEEVNMLLEDGVDPEWLDRCGIEYRWVSRYIRGEIDREEMVLRIGLATDQFIKRQYTWWRRHDDIRWCNSTDEAEEFTEKFLDLPSAGALS